MRRDKAALWYATWLEYEDEGARERDGVEIHRHMGAQWNQPAAKIVSKFVQICFDKMATSLRFSWLVFYLAHVVWLSFTKRRRRYLAAHGYILEAFPPAGVAKPGVAGGDPEVDEGVSLYGLTSLDVVLLD